VRATKRRSSDLPVLVAPHTTAPEEVYEVLAVGARDFDLGPLRGGPPATRVAAIRQIGWGNDRNRRYPEALLTAKTPLLDRAEEASDQTNLERANRGML